MIVCDIPFLIERNVWFEFVNNYPSRKTTIKKPRNNNKTESFRKNKKKNNNTENQKQKSKEKISNEWSLVNQD